MTLTKIASTGVEDSLRWVLGANGTSDYTFTGPGLTGTVNDPTIYLTRGHTYIFQNNSGGHPFYIKTSIANGGTNDAYNTGVTNNGGGNGTEIVFTVPHDSPDILYYQCSSHASMAGQFNIAGSVADGSITTAKIADNAVNGSKIATNAVGQAALADNAVDTAAIANNAVTQQKIAADAVQGTIIANNAITTAKIADGAVTNAKLADNAVTNGKIAASTIITADIADSQITTAKIADDAVTNAKMANNAVDDAVIAAAAVTTPKIADQAVTLAKLPHGTSSNDGKFLRANNGADPTFETVNTDLVGDTSPQLGGDLQSNGNDIDFADNDKAIFGTGGDLELYHSSNGNNYLKADSGELTVYTASNADLYIKTNNENAIKCDSNGAVELYKNNVKQLETTENGILLPKGCIRGMGGSKVIIGGTINPGQDRTWNFSFGTNDNGYNQGYIFNIKFYMNHWNGSNYYKYIESISGGRGNTTGLERVNLINNLGTGSASWSNGHLDYSVSLSGGTRDGNNVSLFKVTYDSDGAPGYTSGYYLEVSYSNQIGTISIT